MLMMATLFVIVDLLLIISILIYPIRVHFFLNVDVKNRFFFILLLINMTANK